MKTDCGIIRDLLPLYTENLCGEESKKAVEEHLFNCPDCKVGLDELRKESELTPLEAAPMKSLTKKLRGKNRKMTILAVLLVLFLSVVAFHHLTEKHYLKYSSDLLDVIPSADGSGLVITPKAGVNAMLEVQNFSSFEDEGDEEYHVSMYKSDKAFQQNQANLVTLMDGVETRIYYIEPGETAVLIYGEKADYNFTVLPRLALSYYFDIALTCLLVLGIAWLLLRFFPVTKVFLSPFTSLPLVALPVSYMFAHFAIKGFNSSSWDLIPDLQHILIAAFFAYIFIVLGISYIKEKKKIQSTQV